jgi:hypothetical protein
VRCPKCRSTAVKERPERTAQSYRRFRCRDCTKQFNERSSGLLNRTQSPSDVIGFCQLSSLDGGMFSGAQPPVQAASRIPSTMAVRRM